jgi:hypothetical protein
LLFNINTFPFFSWEAILLSDACFYSFCPEERAMAEAEAMDRYAKLKKQIPDSLLPEWELLANFLRSAALRAIPSCQVKIRVAAAAEVFRGDCADVMDPQIPTGNSEQLSSIPPAIYWSPACLQLKRQNPATCLIRSGLDCQVNVATFNSGAANITIPVQGKIREGRKDLLREIVARKFRVASHLPQPSKQTVAQESSSLSSIQSSTTTPQGMDNDSISFLAASDTLLFPITSDSWGTLSWNALPSEARRWLDTTTQVNPFHILKTRLGYLRLKPQSPLSQRIGVYPPFEAQVESLLKAWMAQPETVERQVRATYSQGGLRFQYPDTLEYSLWLSPVFFSDTSGFRSLSVRSLSSDDFIDSLVWRAQAKGKTDTLMGPYPSPLGMVQFKIRRVSPGGGKIPYAIAKKLILKSWAEAWVIGNNLRLWNIPKPYREGEDAFQAKALTPVYKNKSELVAAVARLQFPNASPDHPYRMLLDSLHESVLLDRYVMYQNQRDLSRWMDGMKLTREGERLGLDF